MKGQLGTEINFLLAYTAFLVFVVYVSGLAGVTILNNVPQAPTTATAPTLLDVFAPFGYFVALITVSPAAPEFQAIFGLLLIPAAVVVLYIVIKALPFT
jgi:hypothetical protein